MLRRMDAAQALADLTEISSQVVQVAILNADGAPLATTIDDPIRVGRFVEAVGRLIAAADAEAAANRLGAGLAQFEASTLEGSVFAVRDRGRLIAATTRPDPTVGLVLYDLKCCLESLDDAPAPAAPEPRRRAGARTEPRRARSRGQVEPSA
jgi:predicted regulator of Ras-like GTPase activity (Roadblock/LC7/MglB family)